MASHENLTTSVAVCRGLAADAGMDEEEQSLSDKAAVMIVQGVMVALSFVAVKAVHALRSRCNAFNLLPECGAVITVGFLFGAMLHLTAPHFGHVAASFNAEAFLLFILPPIIFDAGFGLTSTRGRISSNSGTILALAIAGTFISTIVVGTLLWLCFDILLPSRSHLHISVWESYAFGALISAVDPVATLAVLSEVFPFAKPSMFYLVFGESVINDAVSIVLYSVCIDFRMREVTFGAVVAAFFRFWGIFVGSLLVGVVISMASAIFLRILDVRKHPTIELMSVLLFALSMYSISEAWDLSGIMTIFVGGRLFKHWTLHNLSLANRVFFPRLAKALAETCELYVFAFLGAAFWSYKLVWEWGFIFATFLLILLGRAANIFPICHASNKLRAVVGSRSPPITVREQVFMWFSGLRGAIAFALASDGTHKCQLRHGDALVTSTLVIVMGTVFIFGGAAKPLLAHLGLAPRPDGTPALPPRGAPATDGEDAPGEEESTARTDELLIRDGNGVPPDIAAATGGELDPALGPAITIGATFGPPPADTPPPGENDVAAAGDAALRVVAAARTKLWHGLAAVLEFDTRWLKPLLCHEPSHAERRRERIVECLLDECANHDWLTAAPAAVAATPAVEPAKPAAAAGSAVGAAGQPVRPAGPRGSLGGGHPRGGGSPAPASPLHSLGKALPPRQERPIP